MAFFVDWNVLNVYLAHWFVIFALKTDFSLCMVVHLKTEIFFQKILIMNTNLLVINSGVAIKCILHIDIPNMKWNRNGKKIAFTEKKTSLQIITL